MLAFCIFFFIFFFNSSHLPRGRWVLVIFIGCTVFCFKKFKFSLVGLSFVKKSSKPLCFESFPARWAHVGHESYTAPLLYSTVRKCFVAPLAWLVEVSVRVQLVLPRTCRCPLLVFVCHIHDARNSELEREVVGCRFTFAFLSFHSFFLSPSCNALVINVASLYTSCFASTVLKFCHYCCCVCNAKLRLSYYLSFFFLCKTIFRWVLFDQ